MTTRGASTAAPGMTSTTSEASAATAPGAGWAARRAAAAGDRAVNGHRHRGEDAVEHAVDGRPLQLQLGAELDPVAEARLDHRP